MLKVLHKCVGGIMNKMVLFEDDQEKYNNYTQFKHTDRKPLNLLEDVSSIQKIIELACQMYLQICKNQNTDSRHQQFL